MITHGFKEDFKEEEQGKEKEKEEKEKEKEVDDFSDQETKEKEKEREKEKVILLKMKAIGQTKNGKDMRMKIAPTKMRQHGNPKAGMNGKSMMNTDFAKEKEREERKEKEKERKVMDLQIKEKDKVMERRSKLCEPITFFSTRKAASSSTFVSECLWFLCDTFTCVLDISQGDREWRAEYGA